MKSIYGFLLLFFPYFCFANSAASENLAGTVWVAEDIDGKGVIDYLQSSIAFNAEGTANGFGGCNAFHAPAAFDGVSLVLGPIAATRKMCFDAITNQEIAFFQSLAQVSHYSIKNGILFLEDDSGFVHVRLWQKEKIQATTAVITGSVTYHSSIALPDNAKLVVELRDVSKADVASVLIAEITIPAGEFPIAFELPYDEKQIDQRFSYSLSAKIFIEDKVLFRTTSHYAVITRGNPLKQDLMLDMVN